MSKVTYQRRKAAGLCVWCTKPTEGTAYCAACRAHFRQADYQRRGLTPTQQAHNQLAREVAAKRPALTPAVQIEGPAVACCGQWHAVIEIPFVSPCCHRLFFAEAP